MASDVRFENRFGLNWIEFGESRFQVRGLTAREAQYFEEQKAGMTEAERASASDRLLVRLGCHVSSDVRGPDGQPIQVEFETVPYLGDRVSLIRDDIALQFPNAAIRGLSQAIWLLSNLTNKETAELIFTGPRASSSAGAEEATAAPAARA